MEKENDAKKFKNTFEISYEDFMIARFQPMIGVFQKFISEFEEERVLQLISEYMDELSVYQISQSLGEQSIENFAQFKVKFMGIINSEFMKNSVTYQIVEDTENKMEFKFTKCLWAKVMKQLGFDGEQGYMTCCKADFAMATAFHPKVKLTRS